MLAFQALVIDRQTIMIINKCSFSSEKSLDEISMKLCNLVFELLAKSESIFKFFFSDVLKSLNMWETLALRTLLVKNSLGFRFIVFSSPLRFDLLALCNPHLSKFSCAFDKLFAASLVYEATVLACFYASWKSSKLMWIVNQYNKLCDSVRGDKNVHNVNSWLRWIWWWTYTS